MCSHQEQLHPGPQRPQPAAASGADHSLAERAQTARPPPPGDHRAGHMSGPRGLHHAPPAHAAARHRRAHHRREAGARPHRAAHREADAARALLPVARDLRQAAQGAHPAARCLGAAALQSVCPAGDGEF